MKRLHTFPPEARRAITMRWRGNTLYWQGWPEEGGEFVCPEHHEECPRSVDERHDCIYTHFRVAVSYCECGQCEDGSLYHYTDDTDENVLCNGCAEDRCPEAPTA